MVRKFLLCLGVFCGSMGALSAHVGSVNDPFAQDQQNVEKEYPKAPDNEQIYTNITNIGSSYYYPFLIQRYRDGDTTLNLEEYRHLYYGYALQPNYQPFSAPQGTHELIALFAEGLDSLTSEMCKQMVTLGEKVMSFDPFNPMTINLMIFAYGALEDHRMEEVNHRRLMMVLQTIESSGTGLKESSPWHILYFDHATSFMTVKEFFYGRAEVVSRTVEYIPLLIKKEGVKGYYFNYGRIYWFPPDYHGERRPQ